MLRRAPLDAPPLPKAFDPYTYSERRPIPDYEDPRTDDLADEVGSMVLICATVVALPTAALFFTLGYLSGLWGWL